MWPGPGKAIFVGVFPSFYPRQGQMQEAVPLGGEASTLNELPGLGGKECHGRQQACCHCTTTVIDIDATGFNFCGTLAQTDWGDAAPE